jgi:ferritin-like metal-binding protein YciE
MTTGSEKIVQYLNEAQATEAALVRTLQAHIAVTPKGDYRKLLERHLEETERHEERVSRRLKDLGEEGPGIVESGVGAIQSLVGQVAAFGKAPLDLVRGEGGEEKLLKNAKDECATEALEIATYESLATLARHVGDAKTGDLADRIRSDEERMLEELRNLLPALTEAAAKAEVVEPSYDISTTGAADAAREAVGSGRQAVERTRARIIDAARTGIDQVTDAAQNAIEQVTEAAQRGEATVEATARAAVTGIQETAKQAETAVRQTAEAAREVARETADEAERQAAETPSTRETAEPWSGYDEQTVEEINERLKSADQDLARRVRDYERRHKQRSMVLERARSKAA